MLDVRLDFEPPQTVRVRLRTHKASDGALDTRMTTGELTTAVRKRSAGGRQGSRRNQCGSG